MMNFSQPFGFNPMLSAQQRLAQMEQQYAVQQNQIGFKAIPVTNKEEANATPVDINGTPTFFYNQAKSEIYIKRVNLNTGLAEFLTFGRLEEPSSDVNVSGNIFSYEKDFQALNEKLDTLHSILIQNTKKEIKIEAKNAK